MFARAQKPISTQVYLLGLVAGVALPLMLFTAVLLERYTRAEQARYEREALQIARQIALVIDTELTGLVSLLKGLATSTALQQKDFGAFYEQAKSLTAGTEEVILLREFGPHQLLNTELPYGQAIPPAIPIPPIEQQALVAGRPLVTSVYLSPINKEPRIAVAITTFRNGLPEYLLGVTVPTKRIYEVLRAATPEGWVIGVADKQGVYVTRSARHEEVTAKPGLPEYLAQAKGRSGTFISTNFESVALLAGYFRSDTSDWLFAANIPQAVVQAPLWRSLSAFAALGVAALGLSALLAYLFGKRFTDTATALARRATALGQGLPVKPMATRLSEFAIVGDALNTAAEAIAERERERERTAQREALLASIFDAASLYVGILEILEDDYRYLAANKGTAILFGKLSIDGMTGRELGLTSADIESRLALFQRCTDGPVTLEYGFTKAGNVTNWNLGTFAPLPHSPEGRRRLTYTSLDITDRKRAEGQRELLVNELNHRVKNSLATVQSVAHQTFRGTVSLKEARDAFTGRLLALSKAHDILTQESWRGAIVNDIVAETAEPYGGPARISICGPRVWLSPSLALSLSLTLHELATNAAKYGALSVNSGMVTVKWEVVDSEDKSQVKLFWAEHHGPPVKTPGKSGFGTRLIQGFSYNVGGAATLCYEISGVTCELIMPLQASPEPFVQPL